MPLNLWQKFKRNPQEFLVRREANSGYEIEIRPLHQILVWRGVLRYKTCYEMDPWLSALVMLGVFDLFLI